jgi:periplasmic divalent cation tolerance protein
MMFIGWTTVAHREDAERLAADAVARGLAVCVQIEGPVTSHYCWAGKDLREEEFRLCFKFLESRAVDLDLWLHGVHPYNTPEWVAVRAQHVGEKYLSWARSNPTHSTL